ncbi:MAG: bifunctional phosphoribosylaminoimidazolecarboxamide formyltransferase/IMP cyclohydrolase [Candidatus Omnitrophica bacterium]|nr:bifunctional phosphoribosylaminoimidazolecarboxamide formyltransferase/IMP cyclohydrolase [Candidatus Omnitrophota bacterium]
MVRVRRALISVWDKRGVVDFAKKLVQMNVEIISTGKTAQLLKNKGVPVKEVSSLTQFPEILSGRVKTLHPKVFGGILANKKHPLHMEEIRNLKITPIDMVVVGLYPFQRKSHEKLIWDEVIEYIDIGGVALLRAGAKNCKNVACLHSASQYRKIMEELQSNGGFLSEETLRRLATEVFYVTKEYDNSIYQYFCRQDVLSWDLEKTRTLRYGENPQQKARVYKFASGEALEYTQVQGKELSYNNLMDLDTALKCLKEFQEAVAVIVKHCSPCGVGIDKKLASAYRKAYQVDPVSSFGGIIGLNRKVDKDTAQRIMKSEFKECVIAPSYSKEALKLFAQKKNFRVIEANLSHPVFSKEKGMKDVKSSAFGLLVQERDLKTYEKAKLKTVTRRKPTQREIKDLLFSWKVVKHVKSNAIVVAKNLGVLGIGGGFPNRVGAVKYACGQAVKSTKGAVIASDAFFPKKDSIQYAHKKGIRAIIQPGGSIRDQEVIDACDKYGIAMLFTGMRHFRH